MRRKYHHQHIMSNLIESFVSLLREFEFLQIQKKKILHSKLTMTSSQTDLELRIFSGIEPVHATETLAGRSTAE